MLDSESNVKLIVRIRNPKEDHPKNYDDYMTSIRPQYGSKTPNARCQTHQTHTHKVKQVTKSPIINKSKLNL